MQTAGPKFQNCPACGLRDHCDIYEQNRPQSIVFLANFPAIQSAIKIGSDGMRIQLDIPETEMGNAVALLTMRDKVLRVTVVEDDRKHRD